MLGSKRNSQLFGEATVSSSDSFSFVAPAQRWDNFTFQKNDSAGWERLVGQSTREIQITLSRARMRMWFLKLRPWENTVTLSQQCVIIGNYLKI